MNNVICEHIEQYLPQMGDGKVKYISAAATESTTIDVFDIAFPPTSAQVMLQRVRLYGVLDRWDLELLEAKYHHNLSLRDIAAKYGWVSYKTVQRRLKKIKETLIENGYEQELLTWEPK